MKIYSIIAMCILTISINSSGQKSDPEWEIDFGKSWGRFHQHAEKQTVHSKGSITYLNKRNGTPVTGQISRSDVYEINELLRRLKLHKSEPIPSSEFNRCIGSPHMPISYFSLTQNGREYTLSACREQGYTLILNAGQQAAYKKLLVKLESLFGDEIKKQAS